MVFPSLEDLVGVQTAAWGLHSYVPEGGQIRTSRTEPFMDSPQSTVNRVLDGISELVDFGLIRIGLVKPGDIGIRHSLTQEQR